MYSAAECTTVLRSTSYSWRRNELHLEDRTTAFYITAKTTEGNSVHIILRCVLYLKLLHYLIYQKKYRLFVYLITLTY